MTSMVTASTIGLLASIQFFVYTSLQIPMGALADRFGPNTFLDFWRRHLPVWVRFFIVSERMNGCCFFLEFLRE